MENTEKKTNSHQSLSVKYRPRVIKELYLDQKTKKKLFSMKKSKNIPNLILTGPPGCGKTSTIFCLANEIFKNPFSDSILKLNISEEKGLSIIREKTKSFCSREFPKGKSRMKMIILDEADSMNETSQGALCRMMEKFSKDARFSLICNFPSKIIEPIQSRCAILRFKKIKEALCLEFILKISEKENISFDLSSLEALIFLADGDFRKILNQIEMLKGNSGELKIRAVKKLVPKFKISETLDLIFSILRKEKQISEEILLEFFNQGFTPLDIWAEIFGILKKINFPNSNKLRMLNFFSKLRLYLNTEFCFPFSISRLRTFTKEI